MCSVEEKYLYTTAEDSVIDKDWATGSRLSMPSSEFLIKKRPTGAPYAEYVTIKYSPALWKIIDEIVVNALDHLVRCLGTATPVDCITASVAPTGHIRIYNSGPGIEVVVHKVASEKLGRQIWTPTFLFGIMFQGSNRALVKGSIIGGTNGLGTKLGNCLSTEFVLETCSDSMYFLQRWRDHKSIEEAPKIIDLRLPHKVPAARALPHTTISFLPDYVGLFGYAAFTDEVYKLITDIVRTRMYYAAAYARYTIGGRHPFKIMFNDEVITISQISDIATLYFPKAPLIKSIIIPGQIPIAKVGGKPADAKTADTHKVTGLYTKAGEYFVYPWEVCVAIVDTSSYVSSEMSNVNGIMLRAGKHHRHVLDLIVEAVREAVAKVLHSKNVRFDAKSISNHMYLFMNTKVPNPSWTGQRKDILDVKGKGLLKYSLPAPFATQIGKALHTVILESALSTGPSKKAVKYEKYKPAKCASGKKGHLCTLIPSEGDSAMTQVCMGISHVLGWEYYGAVSLGGVIMNARKECAIVQTPSGLRISRSVKLEDNIFLKALLEIVGLNYLYKYDPSSVTYAKEKAALNYGAIAMCVDQDLDGKGNILGLFLNLFEMFWPNLVTAGFIKWFASPIIRAYPTAGGAVFAFYSTLEFDEWVGAGTKASKYAIRYYKGIGTHSRDETIHMFRSFVANLYTYYLDDRSRELFEIYFGKTPDLRKKKLSAESPVASAALIKAQMTTKLISCSDHLEYETNPYQKDNLARKLDHVIDGQNQAGRKILDGVIKALKPGVEIKVAQLAGYISEHENYHHGEASLADSITGKAYISPGGKQLPFLLPQGQFGTRLHGGKDASSARYIYATLNSKITTLLFPPVDYHLLPFTFDEGKRGDPEYFIPIVPLVILESTELPAHGWKLKTWARDVYGVITNVRRLITLGDDVPLLPLAPTTYKNAPYAWTGEIKTIRGEPYSFGRYDIKIDDLRGSDLVITELPLRVWNDAYMTALNKKLKIPAYQALVVGTPADVSDDIRVRIEIKLAPGAMAVINELGDAFWSDGIEEFFALRNHMDSHLNLMNARGGVSSFAKYEDVMYEWFPMRKDHYAARINRERILMTLKITRYENIIRYITESAEYKMCGRRRADMDAVLATHDYAKINSALLSSPAFTANADLALEILRGTGATYAYLLQLGDLKKTVESHEQYVEKLAEARGLLSAHNAMAATGRFPGAPLWLDELTQLEAQIREGERTFWKFGDEKKFKL